MPDFIYLDNNATTKPLPSVVEAVARLTRDDYANPSSVHQFGQSARHEVELARERVATLVGAKPNEIVFTSGGTESINTAIHSALAEHPDRRHIVSTTVEHSAVLRVLERLAAQGYRVDLVGVDQEGRVDADEWSERINDKTALATLMHVNNETGVILDAPELAHVAADRGVPVHVDAVQAADKLLLLLNAWPVQYASLSGHKIHGPKGVGALYIRRKTKVTPLIVGGTQERLLRGGTENVPGIAGMGVAAMQLAGDCLVTGDNVQWLRDRLEEGVLRSVPFARVNGAGARRVWNTSNLSFEGLEAEAILLLLSEAGICASSGSACSSGSLEESHVLKAMGVEERWSHGAIRFSLSRFTTEGEIDRVLELLPRLLARLTSLRR